MGAGLSGNERGDKNRESRRPRGGTKSPRDCMLKMSAVTQATEAGGGNPRPWSGGVEARGQSMPVKMAL